MKHQYLTSWGWGSKINLILQKGVLSNDPYQSHYKCYIPFFFFQLYFIILTINITNWQGSCTALDRKVLLGGSLNCSEHRWNPSTRHLYWRWWGLFREPKPPHSWTASFLGQWDVWMHQLSIQIVCLVFWWWCGVKGLKLTFVLEPWWRKMINK